MEAELLPFFIPKTICYPGRGSRFSEELAVSFEALISETIKTLKNLISSKDEFIFLGHSFGSLVLFETLRKMRFLKMPLPRAVYLSGRKAPSIPHSGKVWSTVPDRDFASFLNMKGGITTEMLQNKEFLDVFLPIIRADFKLIESYQYKIETPFDIPFYIINGTDDSSIKDEEIEAWQKETNSLCKFKKLPGGHFYHLENPGVFVKIILEK